VLVEVNQHSSISGQFRERDRGVVLLPRTDNLETDRQPLGGPAGGQVQGRKPGPR